MAPAPADPNYDNPYAAPKARVRQPRRSEGGRPLATRLSRLFAFLIDSFAVFGLMLPFIVVAAMGAAESGDVDFSDGIPTSLFVGYGVAAVFTLAQFFLLWTRSQTVGKIAMRMRIDEYATDQRAGPMKTILIRLLVVGMIAAVPLLGFVFLIVNYLFIFGKDQRCIHDLLAGTVVREAP